MKLNKFNIILKLIIVIKILVFNKQIIFITFNFLLKKPQINKSENKKKIYKTQNQ